MRDRGLGRRARGSEPCLPGDRKQQRNRGRGHRREWKVAIARIEDQAEGGLDREQRQAAIRTAPSSSVRPSRGRRAERPRIRSRVGSVRPCASATATATGAASATAVQPSERIQSPTVRLSSGTFATVQPISAAARERYGGDPQPHGPICRETERRAPSGRRRQKSPPRSRRRRPPASASPDDWRPARPRRTSAPLRYAP